MSYFKRFTDCCAGLAVFGALLYLVRSFIPFMKGKDISTIQKLKDFLGRDNADNYRAYAILAIAFTASLIIGILFKKFPFVSVAVSTAPIVLSVDLFAQSRLEVRPAFFIILAAIHVAGCLFECVMCDRERRLPKLNCTFIAGVITTFASGALSLFTSFRLSAMKDLVKTADPDSFNITKLSYFDAEIFNLVKDSSAKGINTDPDGLILLAAMFAVVLIVTVFIGEIFFVDLFFSVIPLGMLIYNLSSKAFLPQGDMLIALALISTVIFFAATFFGVRTEKSKPAPAVETEAEQ